MRQLHMYEQVDRTGDLFTYRWIFDAPFKLRSKLEPHGWKWLRGGRSYVCNDYALAAQTAGRYGLRIESNGTHAVHGVPLYRTPADDYAEFLAVEAGARQK